MRAEWVFAHVHDALRGANEVGRKMVKVLQQPQRSRWSAWKTGAKDSPSVLLKANIWHDTRCFSLFNPSPCEFKCQFRHLTSFESLQCKNDSANKQRHLRCKTCAIQPLVIDETFYSLLSILLLVFVFVSFGWEQLQGLNGHTMSQIISHLSHIDKGGVANLLVHLDAY